MAFSKRLPSGRVVSDAAYDTPYVKVATVTTESKTLAGLGLTLPAGLAEITIRNQSATVTIYVSGGEAATANHPELPPGVALTMMLSAAGANTLQFLAASATAKMAVIGGGE